MRINFDGILMASECLPEGKYPVSIVAYKEAKSTAGEPMIKLEYEIIDGNCAGRKISDNFVFSTKNNYAKAKMRLLLECLGLRNNGEIELAPELFVGKKLSVTTTIRKDANGKSWPQVGLSGFEKFANRQAQDQEPDLGTPPF